MAEFTDEEKPAAPSPTTVEGIPLDDPEKVEREREMRQWKAWVECAKKLREDWEEEYQVEKLERFFLGKQEQDPKAGEPVFNHFAATLKSAQPELFYTNPTFLVRPKPGNDLTAERRAAAAEGVLAAIAAHEDNLEEASELGTCQAHFRIGVLKVCYDPSLVPNPKAGAPIFMTNVDGSPVIDPQAQAPMPVTDPMTGQPQLEPPEVISDETYRFEWVDAQHMLLPDEGPDMRRWTKIGEEVVVPLAEAKEDTRFPAELREQLKSNETKDLKDNSGASDVDHRYENDRMFRYFECYDIRKKKWVIFADGQIFNDFLLNESYPPGVDKHPYSILRFTPIIGPEPSPWPKPEVYDWSSPQREYNLRRQQITEGCKRSARKIYYDESTFKEEDDALKALQSSKDMEAVKVNDLTKPPATIQDPGQTPDIFNDIALLQVDWRIITGQTGAQLGETDANTATEAAFAERASNARTADKRKIITRWLRQAGRKMFQLVADTMTLEMWVKIKGMGDEEIQRYATAVFGIQPEMLMLFPGIKDILLARYGKEQPVQVTRETLTFEAEVDVVPGSMRLRTLDLERKDLMEFLGLIAQYPQLAMSRELLKLCQKTFEFIDDRLVDELQILAQKMMMATQMTAGRAGDNGQGGGAGPGVEGNLQTAMAGAMQQ